jgi:hypothetical protein
MFCGSTVTGAVYAVRQVAIVAEQGRCGCVLEKGAVADWLFALGSKNSVQYGAV